MEALAKIGHNNPPCPIDEITSKYEAEREEAANWLDGTPVQNEAQMLAVDKLREAMRQWRIGLENGQKEATAPLRAIYMAELDRWKPTLADAKLHEDGLVKVVDGFKRKLAEAKAEAERKAREDAEAKARAAREAAMKADAANLEAMQAAEAAKREAEIAAAQAAKASKDTVKGLRTVTLYEVTDHRALLHWIAKHDRDAITAFVDEYARREHKVIPNADGIRVWTEKRAV